MSSADTRTRAIEALDRACSLPPVAGMDGEQVGGGRVLLTYEEAVDALLAAGWRPPADDAAIERAARAMYHADRERRGIDPDYTKMARAALAAAEEGEA